MSLPKIGRGSQNNPSSRFEKLNYLVSTEDIEAIPEEPFSSHRTQFLKDNSKTIISKNESPDVGFKYSVNPYRGCEHGCIYCYARPTHEYFGMSAGLDFESKILVKEDAPELLRKSLLSPSWRGEAITMSGVTDCYQPIEKKLQLTRQCLVVLAEFNNPVSIITKNHLVTRDIDILARLAQIHAASVFVSVTSLDSELCAILEPRTSRPQFRLDAISQLSKAGIPVGVMMAPCIPGLTDHEMPAILKEAARAGASFASYTPIRLPYSVKDLFSEWLETHKPDRKQRVLSLIRSMRDGKLNDSEFNDRMRGKGVFADQLSAMFKILCKKENLNQTDGPELSSAHFQRPGEQLSFLS